MPPNSDSILEAASLADSSTVMVSVSAFWSISGMMMFMISGDSGITGNGMPNGRVDVVTSRNLMVSSRSRIQEVWKPRVLPGFEPNQLILVDHSGPVEK